MTTSKVIRDIMQKYGPVINLEKKPEMLLDILQEFGDKLKKEALQMKQAGGAITALGSVVGKALGVLGVKKKKAAGKVQKDGAKKAVRKSGQTAQSKASSSGAKKAVKKPAQPAKSKASSGAKKAVRKSGQTAQSKASSSGPKKAVSKSAQPARSKAKASSGTNKRAL